MADQSKIDQVVLNLPAWRAELTDWTDEKIGTVLDTLAANVNATVRQFWLQRANETSALTDVADVGASRPLSQTYQHAREMLAYWDRVAGTGGQGTVLGKIKDRTRPRRYGTGLQSTGDVYARTD